MYLFDRLLRKACGKHTIESGEECRYIKTNDYNTIKELKGLAEFDYNQEFYAILVVVGNRVEVMTVIESDNGMYMPSVNLRIVLQSGFYEFLVKRLGETSEVKKY